MGQIVSASEDYVLPLSTMEVQSFCDNIQALPGQCTSMEAWCEQLNMSSCRTRISFDLGLFLSGKWRQRANSCFSRLAPSNSSYTERCCLLLPLFFPIRPVFPVSRPALKRGPSEPHLSVCAFSVMTDGQGRKDICYHSSW